jgi:hypothetical protein
MAGGASMVTVRDSERVAIAAGELRVRAAIP